MKKIIICGMALMCAASISNAAITTVVINGNNLIVTTTNGEDCILSIDSGFVKVNGVDPDTGPLAVGDFASFQFDGDDLPNRIDLSVLDILTYPSFGNIRINAGGGADTFVGSEQSENIYMDEGSDVVESFGAGFDNYYWSPGDGTESIAKTGGGGSFWFFLDGTTGSEDFSLQASDGNLILTENNTLEVVTIRNAQNVFIDLRGGMDSGVSSDLTSLTETLNFTFTKTSGGLTYDASTSGKRHHFLINSAGGTYDLMATPQTNSAVSLSTGSSQDDYVIELKKVDHVTKITTDVNPTDVSMTGIATINIATSNGNDQYYIENVQDESLVQVSLNPGDGKDSVEASFMENIFFRHTDKSSSSEDSMVLDARKFPIVFNPDNGRYESPGYKGFYLPANVDDITIFNEGVFTDELWIVE